MAGSVLDGGVGEINAESLGKEAVGDGVLMARGDDELQYTFFLMSVGSIVVQCEVCTKTIEVLSIFLDGVEVHEDHVTAHQECVGRIVTAMLVG